MDFDVNEYIPRHFPDVLPGAAYTLLSAGSKRTAIRNADIFDNFMRTRGFGSDAPVSKYILVCFMLYRVAGEYLSSDRFSGSVSLSTFILSDLNPLIRRLRFEGRISFSTAEFKASAEFRDCVATCRRLRAEESVFSSARAIYPSDEKRLRSCLTMDTASKRDEALIVLGLRTGFRVKSLASIRLDSHIAELPDGRIYVTIPACKVSRTIDFRYLLTGDDLHVFKRWLVHRRQIQQHSPYLFTTKRGTQITCDSVTMMLKDLSRAAGYGAGFFSSHSLRVGYACLIAAKGFSQGHSVPHIHDQLTDGKRWKENSSSVSRYIDLNLRNHFRDGTLTFAQFCEMDPVDIHCLTGLRATQTRPLDYFEHSYERLMYIATHGNVLLTGCRSQSDIRARIGRHLYDTVSSFKNFIDSARALNEKKSIDKLVSDTVGCLLEEDIVDCSKWLEPELLECVSITKLDNPHRQLGRFAQRTCVHKLFNRRQAEQLTFNLSTRRVYDRKLHIGVLPNDTQVLLRTRILEADCLEAQLPPFNLDLHFPLAVDGVINDAPEAPAGTVVGVEYSREHNFSSDDEDVRPPTPLARRHQSTPSTSASSGLLTTPVNRK